VHDVFDGQVLFDPGRGVVVLREERAFECLGVNDVDVLCAFEADAMDNCVDELLATDIGEEHWDSVGYLAFVGEESEIGDEFFAGGLGCDAGLALEVANGFFRDIFPFEPGADAHIEVELSGIIEDLADIGRFAKLLGVGSAADVDGTGTEVGFVLPFFDFHYPDFVAGDGERVDVAIDLGLDLVHRVPQGGALAVAYGEAFRELSFVVNSENDVSSGRVGKGADFFAEFPYFRGNLTLEFYVLAFSLGNQFLCFYLVNHGYPD